MAVVILEDSKDNYQWNLAAIRTNMKEAQDEIDKIVRMRRIADFPPDVIEKLMDASKKVLDSANEMSNIIEIAKNTGDPYDEEEDIEEVEDKEIIDIDDKKGDQI